MDDQFTTESLLTHLTYEASRLLVEGIYPETVSREEAHDQFDALLDRLA